MGKLDINANTDKRDDLPWSILAEQKNSNNVTLFYGCCSFRLEKLFKCCLKTPSAAVPRNPALQGFLTVVDKFFMGAFRDDEEVPSV